MSDKDPKTLVTHPVALDVSMVGHEIYPQTGDSSLRVLSTVYVFTKVHPRLWGGDCLEPDPVSFLLPVFLIVEGGTPKLSGVSSLSRVPVSNHVFLTRTFSLTPQPGHDEDVGHTASLRKRDRVNPPFAESGGGIVLRVVRRVGHVCPFLKT